MDINEKILEIIDWIKTRPDFNSLYLDDDPMRGHYDIVCIGKNSEEINRWDLFYFKNIYYLLIIGFINKANTMQHVIVSTAKQPMYESKEYQDTVIEPTLGIYIRTTNESLDEEDYLLEYPEN